MDLPPQNTPVPDGNPDHDYDTPWPWHQAEHLRELLAEGLSRREMAERMGTTKSTIDYWIDKHGLN